MNASPDYFPMTAPLTDALFRCSICSAIVWLGSQEHHSRWHDHQSTLWKDVHARMRRAEIGRVRALEGAESDAEQALKALYTERARLVALLAALYPSALCANDPNAPAWWVVYIDGPTGQMSWHIAVEDLSLFDHVQRVDAGHPAVWYDGHTTALKHSRLEELVAHEITHRAP